MSVPGQPGGDRALGPGARGRVRLGAFVFVIAVLPHAMTWSLPFQLDDYNILSLLWRFADAGEMPAVEGYFFRPTSWALWIGLMKLGGGIAHAPVFHAVILLAHGLTAWLLYRVLRRAAGDGAAFAGAALFGLAPGGMQAVTWTAAAGDQLALLFLVVAVLLAQRFALTGRFWTLPLVAACAAASFLAKESMIAWMPAAALGLWSTPRSRRRDPRWWLPALGAALGLGAGVVLRWAQLGILGPSYAYDVTLTVEEIGRIQKPFFQMLVPWNRAPEFGELAPRIGPWIAGLAGGVPGRIGGILREPVGAMWMAVVVALGVPVGLGWLRRPLGIPRAVLVLGAFVLAFLPSVAAWRFDVVATNTLSRTFYGPLAIFFAFVAVSIEPLFAHEGGVTRALRRVAIAFLLCLVVIQVDLLVHVWRTELLVARRIRSRIESIEAIARAESPDTHLVAVDSEGGLGGMPLLGNGVAQVLRRPFSTLDRRVSFWHDLVTIDRCAAFRKEPGPIRVAEAVDHRYVARGVLIPAMPVVMPALVPVAGMPGRFAFAEPVAARAVAAIRVRARRASAGLDPSCAWEGDGGADGPVTLVGPLVLPESTDASTVLAPPPIANDRPWQTLQRVRSVEFRGMEVIGAPEVVATLPEIELRIPIADHIVVLGALPRIAFRVPFDSTWYRITFDFMVGIVRFPMIYTVTRERLERIAEREYAFVPAAEDRVQWVGHVYEVTWHGLPEAFRREFAGRVQQIAVQFRVEGLAADGTTPESESAWDTLTLDASR